MSELTGMSIPTQPEVDPRDLEWHQGLHDYTEDLALFLLGKSECSPEVPSDLDQRMLDEAHATASAIVTLHNYPTVTPDSA